MRAGRTFEIWVALGLLACALTSSALDTRRTITQYTIDNWTAEHGLPQNSVMSIMQSREGFLWMGTEEGLVRFDGMQFTTFDSSNTPALVHPRIRAVYQDRQGTYWIGTLGGGITLIRNGEATAGPNEGMSSDQVYFFHEDAKGDMWVGTESGLHRLNRRSNQWQIYATREGLPSDNVLCLFEDTDGAMWIGTDAGLARMQNGKVEVYGPANGLPDANIRAVLRDRSGILWVGTDNGLARLAPSTPVRFLPITNPSAPLGCVIYSIVQDREGNVWFGTSVGLGRFIKDRFEILGAMRGLPDHTILTIFEDREGLLWLGTYSGGLVRLRSSRFTNYTTSEGLADNMTSSVHQDAMGALWIATQRGITRLFEGQARTYTSHDGLANDHTGAVFTDSKGTLWVGTDYGLSRFRDGVWKSMHVADGLPNEYVTSIFEDREGSLWFGTRGGLMRMANDRVVAQYNTHDGLNHANIRFIHQDHAGKIWVGTAAGICEQRSAGKFVCPGTADGLAGQITLSIYEDKQGVLWIGTDTGLSRYKDGRFTTFTPRDGLASDTIFAIMEDNHSRLWMSSSKGVFYVEKQQFDQLQTGKLSILTPVVFGKADGMKTAECNGGFQPAGWKTSDGRLWFPTIRGVTVVDPERESKVPSLVITSMLVNRRNAKLLADGTANVGDQVGGGDLEFHYAGLSFEAPEKIRYRYKLEGVDPDWVDVGTRREAFYTLVPPGPYRFLVQGRRPDGSWNSTGAELAFYVPPHFYQTTWFRTLAVLLALILGPVIYFWRVRALKARQRELETLVERRTIELRVANEGLKRLSTTDYLTGIANHRHFQEFLSEEWRRGMRSRFPVSLLLMDVDHFKRFNDTYGHPAGDACLRSVAQVLGQHTNRPTDLAARYGGEEFAVILSGTATEGASIIAERIRAAVDAIESPKVSVSVGVATMVPHELNQPSQLIAEADACLYRAKHEGRNCVRVGATRTAIA